MSDSGFSGLPPGAATSDRSFPPGKGDRRAQIIELRGPLRDNPKPQRLAGEVIRSSDDGRLRIRTDKGELELLVRGRDLPREGQKIEIDIPAGRPPRQAVIRPEPQDRQQAATRETAPERSPRTDPQRAEQEAVKKAPRRPAPPPATYGRTTPPPAASPPPPDQPIRLLPLPPAQAANLQAIDPEQIIETVLQQITDSLQFRAVLSTQKAEDENIRALLTTTAKETFTQILPERPSARPLFIPQGQPIELASPPLPGQAVIQPNANLPVTKTDSLTNLAVPTKALETLLPAPAQISLLQGSGLIDLGAALPFQRPQDERPVPPNIFRGILNVQVKEIGLPAVTFFPVSGRTNESISQFTSTLQSTKNTHLLQKLQHEERIPLILSQPQATDLPARIIGKTPQNHPVLTIPTLAGEKGPFHFILPFATTALPEGTLLQLSAQTDGSVPATSQAITVQNPAAALAPPSIYNLRTGFDWPALDQMIQTLAQVAPQNAHAMTQMLPTPERPAQIPATALFFMAAIRSGDFSGLLGDKGADLLRRIGKAESLSRVGREFGLLQRTESSTPGADWKFMPLPLMWDNQLHKLHLYYRRDDGKKNDDDDTPHKKGTRFLFDLNLDHIGPVQLDGLHRGHKLDLIVRTNTPFSAPMQRAMRQTYINALEQTDFTGELSFQNRPEQFITVILPKENIGVSV